MSPAKRGEVWLVDLGQPKEDHEQAGRRPAIIFQTDDLSPLSTVVIIPLTTQSRRAGFANTVLIPARLVLIPVRNTPVFVMENVHCKELASGHYWVNG